MQKNQLEVKPDVLKKVITELLDGIESDKRQTLKILVDIITPKAKIEDIDYYNLFISHELEYAMEFAVEKNYPNCQKHKLAFLFLNFTFVSQNVEFIIAKRESICCVCDKSHWLIRSIAQYYIDGTEFDMIIDDKCFWNPT